ncbi:MAG TPA: peptidoglycan recognition family protein [Candidatus Angelobacter sp.]|nr:peptidoglycan recognition family protein [Candidatus Angelobacter sp.]
MPPWKGIVGRGFSAADFEDYAATVELNVWQPQFVVVHNTQVPRLSDWHKIPGEQHMKDLESYYRDTQHWSAGPHLFVADDLIWVFTPLNTPGVHSPSWNAISWGVEIVGDYDIEPLTDGTRENAITALAALHQLAGLDPQGLHIHKEDPKTTHTFCPGRNIVKSDFIQWITDRMDHNAAAADSGDSGQTDDGQNEITK